MDHFVLSRSIKRRSAPGFSGTYYRGSTSASPAEAFLLGLGYEDACRLPAARSRRQRGALPLHQHRNVGGGGGHVRRARSTGSPADEFISPFVRAGAVPGQQPEPLLVVGEAGRAELVIYDDNNKGTRLRPAFGLGAGATSPRAKGYQLRWEIRDNIVGIQRVTGVASAGARSRRTRPSTSTCSA